MKLRLYSLLNPYRFIKKVIKQNKIKFYYEIFE